MLPQNSLSIETHTIVEPDLGPVVCERLLCGSFELSNAIHRADWNTVPIHPIACELCLDPICSMAGFAHVVRTNTQVLWMMPYHIDSDWLFDPLHPNLLIERATWDEVQSSHEHLPESSHFPQITNHDLYHLWRQELAEFVMPSEYDTWARHLEKNCIAGHPFELDVAIAQFEDILQIPESPVEILSGSVHRAEVTEETFQHFYFDGEATPEFAAFSVDLPRRLLVDGDYIFS